MNALPTRIVLFAPWRWKRRWVWGLVCCAGIIAYIEAPVEVILVWMYYPRLITWQTVIDPGLILTDKKWLGYRFYERQLEFLIPGSLWKLEPGAISYSGVMRPQDCLLFAK